MVVTDTRAVHVMRDLSWHLAGVHTVDEIERVTLEWLSETVPGSHVALTDFPATGPTRCRIIPWDFDSAEVDRNTVEHFSDGQSDHPLVVHYFYKWQGLTPLRISDLLSDRELRSTRVYSQVFRPAGVTHQLALVNRRSSLTDNAGYTVCRQGMDFTDDEVELATLLQPLLLAVHQVMAAFEPSPPPGPVTEPYGLTATELDILSLLAAGLTAVAIGHVRRISPRTVRKHLENIYAKLGVHDRLLAVGYARAQHLIPDPMPATTTNEAVQLHGAAATR